MWPASRRLLAICSGLKMAPEGSSASPPCPLFPQKARCTQSFMDIPPETPLIMGRKKGQDVTVFAGSLWSLMVVADGAECDVLERDIHILTQKEIRCCLPLQVYTESDRRVTYSVRGLGSGAVRNEFWTFNPELAFLPLPETGHFCLDICEVLDRSRKCEYRLGFRSLFDLLISHSLVHSLLALTLVCFSEVQISDGLWRLACRRLKSDFSIGSSRQ